MDLSGVAESADATRRRSSIVDGILAVGFLALAVGVAVAYRAPARTYELSIYRATPTTFWVGVGVALLASLVVAIGLDGRHRRGLALGLGGSAFAAIAALPLLRGYHFYGDADSLTHLGYLRDLASGTVPVHDFFYPGIHTLGVVLSEGTGFSQERSLLFVVFLTAIVFVLFVPLTVGALVEDEFTVSLGAFAAMMLLPINHVATHYIEPHSMSQTVLLFPLVLFLLVRYLQSDADLWTVTPVGVLLGVASVATVLFHPLHAVVLILLLSTVATLQLVARRFSERHAIADHRPVYGQAGLAVAFFTVWTLDKPRFWGNADIILGEFLSFLSGGDSQAGEFVGEQGDSLSAIGSGLPEIFASLFVVSAVFAGLAGLLGLYWASQGFDREPVSGQYFAAALFVLVPASMALFVGDVSRLAFRLIGSIMVIATVLGTISLASIAYRRNPDRVTRPIRVALVVVIALMLAHSLVIVYTSPYIHKSNRQVTDAQASGYENAFETGAPGVYYAGVRGGPGRHLQAVYGYEGVPESLDREYHTQRGMIRGENLTDVGGHFGDDHYVVVSKRDYERELRAYRGLRYSEAQLDAVRTQRDVHKVRSNGVNRFYLYDADRSEDDPAA